MIRSLFAIVVAIILGLTAAKFVEGAGQALSGGGDNAGLLSNTHQLALVIGWGIGAFTAAISAMLIAGRWAPLGGLAAGTIFLAAVIAQFSGGSAWYLWPLSAVSTALGGYAATRLLGATRIHPAQQEKYGLFDD